MLITVNKLYSRKVQNFDSTKPSFKTNHSYGTASFLFALNFCGTNDGLNVHEKCHNGHLQNSLEVADQREPYLKLVRIKRAVFNTIQIKSNQ